MRFGLLVNIAALAVAAAVGYGVYYPDWTEHWAPHAGGMARQLHVRLFGAGSKTETASLTAANGPGTGQASGARPPIVVSVTSVKRADFPIVLENSRASPGL